MANKSIRVLFGIWLAAFSQCCLIANAASPGAAHSASHKAAKRRTLQELIDFTMRNGEDKNLGETSSHNLGFHKDMPTKTIGYSKTQDGYGRRFYVVLEDNQGKNLEPIAIVMGAAKITKKGLREIYYLRELRISLDGKLEAAAIGGGEKGSVYENSAAIDSKTKEFFRRDLKFYLTESVVLEIDK